MTAAKINFTKATLDKLKCPAGKNRIWSYDARTPGLGFMVTEGGVKSFYLYKRIAGRPERVRLGGYPETTIEQARTAATRENGRIADGHNPAAERRGTKATMTLAELLDHYLTTWAKQRNRTWKEDVAMFERYFGKAGADRQPDDSAPMFPGWRNRKISAIAEADVATIHRKVGADHPYAANRLRGLLCAMYNRAKLPNKYNPALGVERYPETERERFLHPDELPRFFKALANEPNPDIRDFVLLAILTGARRDNIQSMRWDEVALERATWTIPKEKSKSKNAVVVHLAPPALKILEARYKARGTPQWVFPSKGASGHLVEPRGAWVKLLKRANITDLRIHDLRRTLGSWQAMGGASTVIIGKSLGHLDERTTRVYARLTHDVVKQSVNNATAAMEALMPAKLLPAPARKKVAVTVRRRAMSGKAHAA